MKIEQKMILVNKEKKEFHLQNDGLSYIFRVIEKSGQLEQLYFGKQIPHYSSFDFLVERESRPSNNLYEGDHKSSLEHIKQEYPSFGTTDFRYPAFEVEYPEGDSVSHLKYESYSTLSGKSKLNGLPSTYAEAEEAQSLIIVMRDEYSGLNVELNYTIFKNFPVITRSVKFRNDGPESLYIKQALSMSIDYPDSNFEMIHLNGAWARENHVARQPLFKGLQSISSTRGASSHMHNPFFALARPDTTETSGEVYGFSLVYSGNHIGQIEVDTYDVARVSMGINPYQFNWLLEKNDEFQTPEAILVYSDKGINGMSQSFHKLFKNNLMRKVWQNSSNPVLINNWEATYFDFNEDKILSIAERAVELGIELFVLDDGWFGKRDDDTSSLGNWVEDSTKLPNGISGLSKKINNLGMKFGLWFEPEMINKGTPLYEKHPEWVIHVPNKNVSHGRNQYVLDFSNEDVVDEIFKQMDDILKDSQVSYIKWDMNRYISEAFSTSLSKNRQGELYHRYILGVYNLYEKLLQKYPNILIESCAGGGGRFDPGLLYYAPQAWASDDTDAIERLKIQYGTSMVYPLSSIGSHVSDTPNHQVGRTTPIETRNDVALFGTFGYELDITNLKEDDEIKIKGQISHFKENRELVESGTFYRLKSPFNSNETAWMIVSEDKKEVIVGFYQVLQQPNPSYSRLKLEGLKNDYLYQIEHSREKRFGKDLCNIGLLFSENDNTRSNYWSRNGKGDYHSWLIKLNAVE